MANWTNHLKQAQHNEVLAAQLETTPDLRHWDWLITVAFYAAVHYVETAFFFVDAIGHTESACLDGDKHTFRAKNVKNHLGYSCWLSYRKLQDASYNVRYLAMAQQYPSEIASSYYTRQQAADFYATHLTQGRNTVLARLKQ